MTSSTTSASYDRGGCGTTKAPAFAEAARSLEPEMRLAKVDTEAVPALAARSSIRGIPTLILFRDGRELARRPGASGAAAIVEWAHGAAGVHR